MKRFKYIVILLLIVIVGSAVYFSLKDGSYSHFRELQVNAPLPLVNEFLRSSSAFVGILADNEFKVLFESETGDNTSYADGSVTGEIFPLKTDQLNTIGFKINHKSLLSSDTAIGSITLSEKEKTTQMKISVTGEQSFKEKIMSVLDRNNLDDLSRYFIVEEASYVDKIVSTIENDIEEAMTVHAITPNGIVEVSGGYYLYLTTQSKKSQLESTHNQLIDPIASYLKNQNVNKYGEFTQFFLEGSPTDQLSRVATAAPVRERVIVGDDTNLISYFLEPHRAVKVTLKGDRTHIAKAWNEALNYTKSLGIERAEVPAYIIYTNDSKEIVNPADLVTEIYLPVK
ncbi:MAG: GyrI-like domain-containing protein [Nonlabens sp.]